MSSLGQLRSSAPPGNLPTTSSHALYSLPCRTTARIHVQASLVQRQERLGADRPGFLTLGTPKCKHRPVRRCWATTGDAGVPRPASTDVQSLEFQSAAANSSGPGGNDASLHRPGDLLGGKYTVQAVLGRGSSAVAYSALDPAGRTVAVKALSLGGLKDWKQLDLFQREAQIMRALEHPNIPKYVDYFEEDTATDRRFYIVQQVRR